MKIRVSFLSLFVLLLLCSCKSPNVSYFNDFSDRQLQAVDQVVDIRLQPGDKISIVVKSKDQTLANLFNLSYVTHRIGANQNQRHNDYVCVYTIDHNGDIDFPVLGTMHVAGLHRDELGEKIKKELVSQNLVKDAVLIVDYMNLGFNVMGEVNNPGRYSFDRDRLTILDALSMAHDLTIQGSREDVLVIRETEQGRMTYRINLKEGKELLQSPAFYIQQNDVIYVSPNKFRSRQTVVNGNNVLSAPFWISVASLLTSIAVLIFK